MTTLYNGLLIMSPYKKYTQIYYQLTHQGSSQNITRLNCISIPATVVLVTAAMETS